MVQFHRKKVTKKEIEESRKLAGLSLKEMACKNCGRIETKVSPNAVSVICSICVTKMVPLPESHNTPKPPEERRPRGWQFMKKYRAPDGVLYRRGVKVDESEPIQPTKTVASRTRKRTTTADPANKNSNSKNPKDRKSVKAESAKSEKSSGRTKSVKKSSVTKRRPRNYSK
jgi:hypothetical protein